MIGGRVGLHRRRLQTPPGQLLPHLVHGPADQGEGGPELVADVGEEAAFGLVERAELFGLLFEPVPLLLQAVPLLPHLLGPLGDGLLQLLLAPPEAVGAPPVGAHGKAEEAQPTEPVEPPRLPPEGRDRHCQAGRFAERPALPGGLHFERVAARAYLCVADLSPVGPGGPPVEPSEPGLEPGRRRVGEVEPRVPNRERALLGAEAQGVAGRGRVGRVPRRDRLNGGGGRGHILRDGGVDDGYTLLRRKPEAPVRGAGAGRVHSAVGLPAAEAVFFGVDDRVDLLGLSLHEST